MQEGRHSSKNRKPLFLHDIAQGHRYFRIHHDAYGGNLNTKEWAKLLPVICSEKRLIFAGKKLTNFQLYAIH